MGPEIARLNQSHNIWVSATLFIHKSIDARVKHSKSYNTMHQAPAMYRDTVSDTCIADNCTCSSLLKLLVFTKNFFQIIYLSRILLCKQKLTLRQSCLMWKLTFLVFIRSVYTCDENKCEKNTAVNHDDVHYDQPYFQIRKLLSCNLLRVTVI